MEDAPARPGMDLRLAPGAVGVWIGAAVCLGWPPIATGLTAGALWALAALLCRRRSAFALLLGLVVTGAALCSVALRVESVHAGPLSALAASDAWVRVTGRVVSDPLLRQGAFAPYVMVRLQVGTVEHQGIRTTGSSPVLLLGPSSWARVPYAASVEAFGRLEPPRTPDLSAVLLVEQPPEVLAAPPAILQRVAALRAGLVRAAEPLPQPERALLPALVDGDVSRMPAETTAEFQRTGLTHLLAVSGSNLTLVLGFVLFVARWCRLTGYARHVLGALVVVLFVLLARPEPSVLRAAAMGLVALAGLSRATRAAGVRSLAVAVIALVLVDPWLARSAGFALSTLATAGIVVLAPSWREALSRWMPPWLAEAIAVPLAAQLACTPVIAAISSQVSLVAVAANLAAAPAVGPATVLSLLAGLVEIVAAPVGALLAHAAQVPLWWIVTVAQRGAGFAGADLAWGSSVTDVTALAVLCAAVVVLLPWLLPRRSACLLVAGVLVLALLHPLPRLGWPPDGWVMVACDIGQGDGLVLNAGGGSAVVVDTGPDPTLMAACLRDLQVKSIPVVVLTHFHADHVDGLPGVLAGWPVGRIETSPVASPSERSRAVHGWAAAHHVPVRVAPVGRSEHVGQLHWSVLGPPSAAVAQARAEIASGDTGSGPNNASVVLMLRVDGIRILLSGDAEPEEQDALLASGVDLRADVLKEPHHGSGNIDDAFLRASHARASVISVGAGNTYGQPAPSTLAALARLRMRVYRTDLDGSVAVVVHNGAISISTER